MAADIKPGSTINITIKKTPTNEAAAKTLSRLFAKAPGGRRLRAVRRNLRTNMMDVRRRGGRPWEVRQRAPRLFMPEKGDTCAIKATCDVINDLGSVASFVDVKPTN
jgi:hypothetical protein